MQKFKRTNRTAQAPKEIFLVATGDQALASGALVNATTSLGIANAQLGVLSADFDGTVTIDNFITAGVTATQVQGIKVIQGTPKSNAIHTVDPFEVGHKAYVASGVIYPSNIYSVSTTLPVIGNYSAYATTSLPATAASTQYGAYVYLYSVRNDRDYSDNDNTIYEEVITPDSLSTITDTKAWVLNRLAYKFNQRSSAASLASSASVFRGNQPYIVLGINSAGGTGQAIGTVSSATPTTIPVMYDYDSHGNTITTNLIADNRLVGALAKLVNTQQGVVDAGTAIAEQITASSTIEIIDVKNAGAGTRASGTITVTANFSANDTILIGGQTYKFVASPSAAYDVDLGGTAAVSLTNLVAAINGTGTAGTEYAAGTNVNTQVTAVATSGTVVTVYAKEYGTGGNDVVFDEGTDGGGTFSLSNSANGVLTGGGSANIDCLVFLGLDSELAMVDDQVKEVNNNIEVNLAKGYNLNTITRTHVPSVEDSNTGRKWTITNNDRAQLDIHTKQNHPHGEFFSTGRTYIDATKLYTSTITEFYDYGETLTTREVTPKRLTILLEATATPTTVSTAITNLASGYTIAVATDDTTTVAALEATLGAWLDSANTKFGHSLKGLATTGANFV